MDQWDELIPSIVHAINTRTLRVHGHTPSELLFGFNPRLGEADTTPWDAVAAMALERSILEGANSFGKDGKVAEQFSARLANLDEARDRAATLSIEAAARPGPFRRGIWEPIHDGDQVLLRRFEVNKHHGKKLESRWEGPYRLTDLSWHQQSGQLQDVQTGEIVNIRRGDFMRDVM